MTQDEHDAKCWRLLKQSIVETAPNMSREARDMATQLQALMTHTEVYVERGGQ